LKVKTPTSAQPTVQQVPLLDLKAQYAQIRAEVLNAVTRVFESQQFILGAEVDALETELASALGVKHATGVSSGTDALLVAMMALGIGPGDEVITTTYSFVATAGSIVRLGATPVLVDIDPETYNIDPAGVQAALTSRTKAIMPVHLFGLTAECGKLIQLANQHGAVLIEDACQAIGAQYHGRPAGSMGTVGCFSFFPSKNLGGAGDGGLVTTNDDDLAERIRLLRGHGAEKQYVHRVVGGNFRLDALQAAVLRVKLRHLQSWTEARRRNASRYRSLFDEFRLAGVVTTPTEPDGYFHVYNQYVIGTAKRDALRRHLQDRGIGTAVYYPIPFHAQECFRSKNYATGAFPHADRASASTLALPIYSELTAEQQARVVESIAAFFR
jgi:dTDP-4-amino-4,6-dideoxygalactose transaminase